MIVDIKIFIYTWNKCNTLIDMSWQSLIEKHYYLFQHINIIYLNIIKFIIKY